MKAINEYKEFINEVGRVYAIFADNKNSVGLDRWHLDLIHNTQHEVMNNGTLLPDKIKEEIIGDGKETEFKGRIKTALYELGGNSMFVPTYFPEFDTEIFELPSKENPTKNGEMIERLIKVYGSEKDVFDFLVSLQQIFKCANYIVEDVNDVLNNLRKFVCYTPDPQQGQAEPQQDTQTTNTDEEVNKGSCQRETIPQEETHKKLGRKKKPLEDLILEKVGDKKERDKYFERLQDRMKKAASNEVAIDILLNAINNRYISRPSWEAFCDAFPSVKIAESTYYYKLRRNVR